MNWRKPILWWLLDRSPEQWATDRFLWLLERALPLGALALQVPRVRALVVAADALVGAALFGASTDRRQRE